MTAEVLITSLLTLIEKRQQQCKALGWRLPVWLQGSESTQDSLLTDILQQRLNGNTNNTLFWLGEPLSELQQSFTADAQYTIKHVDKKSQLLGLECDVLLINAHQGINWDLVAASAACVKAGGLWLLVSPPLALWQQQTNNQAGKLRSYPHQAAPSAFLRFWLDNPVENNWLVCRDHQVIQDLRLPQVARSGDTTQTEAAASPPAPYFSLDQQQAVQGIFKVLSGHRRRPLLLTAHRGRGKSAALGIAAAELQLKGKTKLVICAPHPDSAAVALRMAKQHLQQLSPDAELALKFWPVDLLLAEKPPLDLLLIDEAAAIPTPQLQQLVAHYSRVVLASTEHGYEGTGRGFSLKFQPYLDENCPGWHKLQLQQAIRYAANCPLEQLIFKRFLLATEYQLPSYHTELPLQLQLLPQQQLGQHPLLPQIMALLSLSHYQTSITDFWALLDNPALQLFVLLQQGQLLACAVISTEGELDATLCQQIYLGERRVQGHLMAQSLAFHLASPQLASEKLARIQRIAVSPMLQQQGIGTKLLQLLEQHCQAAGFAILGSSFGSTATLLRFWQKAGFAAVKLSQQADKASSEASILVIKSLQRVWQAQTGQLQRQFAQDLYWQLSGTQQQLCAALALQLVLPPSQQLSADQWQQLVLFAEGKRPFELVEVLLLHWFNLNYQQLGAETAKLMVKKLWQQQTWQQLNSNPVCANQGGKQVIQQQIQRAVAATLATSASELTT